MNLKSLKNRNFNVLFISTLVSVGLSSCGNKNNSEDGYKLTPVTTNIKGDLSDYYEVVEREYTTTQNYRTMMDNTHTILTVEIRRTDKEFDFEPETTEPMGTVSVWMSGYVGFGIEILDASGDVVTKRAPTEGGLNGMYSSADMAEALKLKPGETANVRWQINFEDDENPATFRLTSAYKKYEDQESTSGGSASSGSSSDWDSILNTYEKYVDQYIVIYKKALNGDISAASKMESMLEKAQELQNKLENAGSVLTPSQTARLAKINAKLMHVM